MEQATLSPEGTSSGADWEFGHHGFVPTLLTLKSLAMRTNFGVLDTNPLKPASRYTQATKEKTHHLRVTNDVHLLL